jgi:hypothetical protein
MELPNAFREFKIYPPQKRGGENNTWMGHAPKSMLWTADGNAQTQIVRRHTEPRATWKDTI